MDVILDSEFKTIEVLLAKCASHQPLSKSRRCVHVTVKGLLASHRRRSGHAPAKADLCRDCAGAPVNACGGRVRRDK